MVTPVISLDKSQNGYLGITDITTYTTGQRALTAIQMFWSSDNFAADVNLDQSNADNWDVPVSAQATYNVYALYSYVFDVANNVNMQAWAITFYGGYFYIKYTTGTINPSTATLTPPQDTTHWGLLAVGQAVNLTGIGGSNYASLTEADIYTIAVSSAGQNVPTSVAATSITFIDTDAFVLSKQDCEKWDVAINIDCTVVRLRLYNYDGTMLSDDFSVDGTTVHIDLSPYGDGSYTFEIAYVLDIGNQNIPNNWLIVQIPILEVCNANACYTKLFKYTICKCDDPCDPCEDLTTKQRDMLAIRELVTSINQMVNLQRSQYIGIYPITKSESDLLTDIGQMIDKLKLVTDRCGLCGCTDDNDITC